MSDHNKCPSSEKEHEKCIFRLSYFHRIQPNHEGLLLDIEQMFDNDSVFGAKISQTIIETPLEYRFVWAHWRHHHTFVTVSTLKIFDLSKSKP